MAIDLDKYEECDFCGFPIDSDDMCPCITGHDYTPRYE